MFSCQTFQGEKLKSVRLKSELIFDLLFFVWISCDSIISLGLFFHVVTTKNYSMIKITVHLLPVF